MSKVGPGLGDTAAGMSWTPASSRAKLAAKETAKMEELTEKEMEAVTTVFRSFETGLREASIDTKVGQLQLWFILHFHDSCQQHFAKVFTIFGPNKVLKISDRTGNLPLLKRRMSYIGTFSNIFYYV